LTASNINNQVFLLVLLNVAEVTRYRFGIKKFLIFWADYYIVIYTHFWELMKSVRSHVWLGTECRFYSSMQQRTKKEIMEEVISKSKFYKASALSQEGIMACCCLMFVSVVKHLM
jgi:hypothetical protein